MKLSQTNSGNWAKEVEITSGGRWHFCNNFATHEQAEKAAKIHEAKNRKVQITEESTSKNQEKKQRKDARNWEGQTYTGPVEGRVYFRLEAYFGDSRRVMTHATAAECEAAGVKPGPMNI